MKPRIYFSREEMFKLNRERLLERGVKIEDIAEIAFHQQGRYNKNISMKTCIESVEKSSLIGMFFTLFNSVLKLTV